MHVILIRVITSHHQVTLLDSEWKCVSCSIRLQKGLVDGGEVNAYYIFPLKNGLRDVTGQTTRH